MTDTGFSRPNRLHPWTVLLGPLRRLQGFVLPIVVLAIIGGGLSRLLGLLVPLVVFATVAVAGELIRYVRVQWWVEGDRFELRGGLLQRESRSVPLERIQSVGVDAEFLARLFSVAVVRVETAGGAGPEIVLRYLDRAEAERLRLFLAHPEAESEAQGPHGAIVPAPELSVPTGELVVAGATSNRIGALAVLTGAVLGNLESLGLSPWEWLIDRLPAVAETDGSQIAVVVASVALAAVVVGWGASIVGTVLRFHGFELRREGDRLRRSHGLLTTVSSSTPISRVQAVRVDRPLLQRWVRRGSVVAETAGSPGDEAGGSGVLTPIVRLDEVDDVVALALPDAPVVDRALTPVHPLSERRGRIRFGLLGVPGVVGTWPLAGAGEALVLALLWSGLAWWYGRARYAALGYRMGSGFLESRRGLANRRTWLVPLRAVQEVSVTQSPFQRRLGLADVVVHTAAVSFGRVRIVDLSVVDARTLATGAGDVAEQTALPDAV